MIIIDEYQIDTENQLGRGSLGCVYNVITKQEGFPLCAKIIVQPPSLEELNMLNFFKDKLNDNLVAIYSALRYQNMFVVIMEKCESDLQKEINKMKDKRFSEYESIQIMKQLLNGYRILYDYQILHKRIYPCNVLVKAGRFKIKNYAFSNLREEMQENNQLSQELISTPLFKAPEQFGNYVNKEERFSEFKLQRQNTFQLHKVDIYQFGLLFYFLLTGSFPFEKTENGIINFINKIKLNPFQMNPKSNISPGVCNLIQRMLSYSPSERISFPEIIQLPLFKAQGPVLNPTIQVVQKRPAECVNDRQIIVVSPQKQIQEWIENLRLLFLEKCYERFKKPDIYINYCDLCLQLARTQLDQNVSEEKILEYSEAFLEAILEYDVKFKIEITLENGYYILEFFKILSNRFIPRKFDYEKSKQYGESHLRFIFIYLKLKNNEYNFWNQVPGFQKYQRFKDQIFNDSKLNKDDLKKYLDSNY